MNGQNTEKWLALRDSKTGRYIKQIKLNFDIASKSDINACINFVLSKINSIDNKYMSVIKSEIEFHLIGLQDFQNSDVNKIATVKYNLQTALFKLIIAALSDIKTNMCSPSEMKLIIESILLVYDQITNIREDIKAFAGKFQQIYFEDNLETLVHNYNQYLDNLKNSITLNNHFWANIPQNCMNVLQITSAININTINIKQLENLHIEVKSKELPQT